MRWIGSALVVLALGLLAADLVAWSRGAAFWQTAALGDWWRYVHFESLQSAQPAVERYVSPDLWYPYIQTLLEWPAFAEFGVLGLAFLGVSRALRRRRSKAG